MGNMGTVCDAYRGTIQDPENLRTSSASSEDQILYEAKKNGVGSKSIFVSRQVEVERSGV